MAFSIDPAKWKAFLKSEADRAPKPVRVPRKGVYSYRVFQLGPWEGVSQHTGCAPAFAGKVDYIWRMACNPEDILVSKWPFWQQGQVIWQEHFAFLHEQTTRHDPDDTLWSDIDLGVARRWTLDWVRETGFRQPVPNELRLAWLAAEAAQGREACPWGRLPKEIAYGCLHSASGIGDRGDFTQQTQDGIVNWLSHRRIGKRDYERVCDKLGLWPEQ